MEYSQVEKMLLNKGWQPPSSAIDNWKPPKGTMLRDLWEVDITSDEWVRIRLEWEKKKNEI
jgi:hypothetical protein